MANSLIQYYDDDVLVLIIDLTKIQTSPHHKKSMQKSYCASQIACIQLK